MGVFRLRAVTFELVFVLTPSEARRMKAGPAGSSWSILGRMQSWFSVPEHEVGLAGGAAFDALPDLQLEDDLSPPSRVLHFRANCHIS